MNIDCYHCGEPIKVIGCDEGDWIECPHCEASAPVPATPSHGHKRLRPFPVVLPRKRASDPFDDEELIDLRERRRYRNEDRAGNPIGIAGFALAATTLLFLLGAMILCKPLPAYLWVVAILSVPSSLLGVVLSIIGSLLVGRPRLVSVIGAGIGGFLILVGLPVAFLLLKGS